MTDATKLGQAVRRIASLGSVRNVRRLEEQRIARLGSTSDELNAQFVGHLRMVEARLSALEAEVLGEERTG